MRDSRDREPARDRIACRWHQRKGRQGSPDPPIQIRDVEFVAFGRYPELSSCWPSNTAQFHLTRPPNASTVPRGMVMPSTQRNYSKTNGIPVASASADQVVADDSLYQFWYSMCQTCAPLTSFWSTTRCCAVASARSRRAKSRRKTASHRARGCSTQRSPARAPALQEYS